MQRKLTALLLALTATACSDGVDATGSADADRLRIAMIPKGTTHTFWNTVKEGADRAAEELDVTLIWKGPLEENDRGQQIGVVQQFVSQGVDGILLAPLDHRALARPVQAAKDADIPVLIFDSALDGTAGEDFLAFVATDNSLGGKIAGEALVERLGEDGKAVLLRYLVGSASTDERETAFLEVCREAGVEVLVDNRYAGATVGDTKTTVLNMLEPIRAADAVFASNESATHGMLLALRQEGLLEDLVFVGFDASPPLVEALDAGELDALVVQDPRRMGYLAVQTMVAHLNGETVEPFVDTGVVLVTRENRGDPEIARLLE